MKTGIHPDNYRLVAVKDMSIGETFITKSCADTKETITIFVYLNTIPHSVVIYYKYNYSRLFIISFG